VRIRGRADLLVGVLDASVLVDDVGDALGVLVVRTGGRAVGHADLAVGVAEERKGEVKLLRELGAVFLLVEGDAEDLRVFLLVLRGEVPEPGTFGGSPRGVGLRKEPEHDLAAAEVTEPHRAAAMVLRFEVRSRIANFQHLRTSKDVLENPAQGRHILILCRRFVVLRG
jgi:AAA+ ATPase superfamily predicted ATPase